MVGRIYSVARRIYEWIKRESIWLLVIIEWFTLLAVLWIYLVFTQEFYPIYNVAFFCFFLFIGIGFVWGKPYQIIGKRKPTFIRYFLNQFSKKFPEKWGGTIGFLLWASSMLCFYSPIPINQYYLLFSAGGGSVLVAFGVSFNFGESDEISIREALCSSLEFLKKALGIMQDRIPIPTNETEPVGWDHFLLDLTIFSRGILYATSGLSAEYVQRYLFHMDEPDFDERFALLAYVHGFSNPRRQWQVIQVIDDLIRFVSDDSPRAFAEKLLYLPHELGVNQADWADVREITSRFEESDQSTLSGFHIILLSGVTSLIVTIIMEVLFSSGFIFSVSISDFLWIFQTIGGVLYLVSGISLFFPILLIGSGKRWMKFLEVVEKEAETTFEKFSRYEGCEEMVKRLIKAGESETLEWKSGVKEALQEDLVAFANTRGGTILVGVGDDGYIKGARTSQASFDNIRNSIVNKAQTCTPHVRVDVSECEVDNKPVVIVDVYESLMLHRWNKDVYIRRSGTTRIADESEIEWIIQRRNRPHRTYVDLA